MMPSTESIVVSPTFYGKPCSACGFQIYQSHWACRAVTILNCQHWVHTLCFGIIYQSNYLKIDSEQALTCPFNGCHKKTALKGVISDLPSKNLLVKNPQEFTRYLITYFSTEKEMQNHLTQSWFKAIFFGDKTQNQNAISFQAQILEKEAFSPIIYELILNLFNKEQTLLFNSFINGRKDFPFHQLVTSGNFRGALSVISKAFNSREFTKFFPIISSLLEKNNYINLIKYFKEMSLSSQGFLLDYLLLKKKAKEDASNSDLSKLCFDVMSLWQFEG